MLVGSVWGFSLLGPRWPDGTVVMHLQLGSSGGRLIDGSASWGDSAEAALALWNAEMRDLKFRVVRDSTVPVRQGDDVNNVFFAQNVYGTSFGGAIAITTLWRTGNRRTEADVVFNTRLDWNSYRGPLRNSTSGDTLFDLRRVALHEFGHVLGLDHPDEFGQNVRAVMNSSVSNLDALQDDDISGVQFLYGRGRGGVLVEVTRPSTSTFTTNRSRFVIRGRATGGRVQAILAANNRLGSRLYRARGSARWRVTVPLRSGVNRITLRVRTDSGRLQKAAVVRIRRQ